MRRRGTASIRTRGWASFGGAIEALLEPGPGRAETVQHIFSLEYDRELAQEDERAAVEFSRFVGGPAGWLCVVTASIESRQIHDEVR